ncbi:MAG: EAL domain-containing protein, partial [Actinomycetes bacterium]
RPDGCVIDPAGFLPLAERTDLITEVDQAVLVQSVQRLRALAAPLFVAVNVSATSIATRGYAQQVTETLNNSGVDPIRLHLEFTETALLGTTDGVKQAMAELSGIGVRWYVDDFGTGYSSISHLRDLPVAGLKLDLSFTAGLVSKDPTCENLAQALVGLAGGLGLDTVAEGIETQQQADILIAQGWQHGQGWLHGRSQPLTSQPAS